jgi:hypothetical protein
MHIRQLREVLALQEQHCREDRDDEKANAIASFANLLEGNDELSVSEFVQRVLKAHKRAVLSPDRTARRRR